MLDLHVHVWPHEPGTPPPTYQLLEQYCEAAAALGISHIAITEHSHRFVQVGRDVLPHWERPSHGDLAAATDHVLEVEGGADLDAYVDALLDAQTRGLPILIGLEVDHLRGAGPAMADLLEPYPFDVLLGSVHWLDDWLFDAYGTSAFAQRWRDQPVDRAWSAYVDAVLELAQSGTVDVLAHLDVIKVAGHVPANARQHLHRLADGLKNTDLVIEFSSAGLRKPAAGTYPDATMLAQLVAAGKPITTASDAHTAQQIGHRFDVLETALNQIGVTELTSFSRRRRIPYPRPSTSVRA